MSSIHLCLFFSLPSIPSQKLDTVIKLCEAVEAKDVFNKTIKHSLSNAVSLSLIQQLAFELKQSTVIRNDDIPVPPASALPSPTPPHRC